MRILKGSTEIQEALSVVVQPTKVAVAYIGKDYHSFIQPETLKSIVVSPTFGSNPEAIGNLVEKIGWNKIFFLDRLHSKVYIGKKAAIIASSNLSKNGLGNLEDSPLLETGVLIDDKLLLKDVNGHYEDILNYAKESYPSDELKMNQLQKLHSFQRKAIVNDFVDSNVEKKVHHFNGYSIHEHGKFHILGYTVTSNDAINMEKVNKKLSNEIDNVIELDDIDWVLVKNEDIIKENDWLLIWKKRKDNNYNKTSKPSWFYVHKIVKGGSNLNDLPNAIIRVLNKKTPSHPFEIDDNFCKAFCNTIDREEFSDMRESVYLQEIGQLFEQFTVELKKEYKNG